MCPFRDFYAFYARMIFQQPGGVLLIGSHFILSTGCRRTCRMTSGDLGRYQQFPPLDDSHLVADVGKLRQDVAGDHDGLAHGPQLF